MPTPIIEIKDVGKKYNITHQRGKYVALRDVIANVAKSPFQFIKSKSKQVMTKEGKEEFWALKDINFEVMQGEAIGIIGANGAGKSTLLKILSKITPPTTGEIKIRGKVASLLEVGTGFHPELTGRENVFFNGAILGMTKKEIAKKFDDIVKFAGVERFIDTPVKRYSSGMQVRLAFSVAAHIEPEVLLVDEVLAVGDAEFQKKCLGKMNEVTKTAGRTIMFVSHNMTAIQKLCQRCVLLENGKIKMIGPTDDVIRKYSSSAQEESDLFINHQKIRNPILKVVDASINGQKGDSLQISSEEKEIKIELTLVAAAECRVSMYATLRDRDTQAIGFYSPGHMNNTVYTLSAGQHKITGNIILPPLAKGQYFFDLGLADPSIAHYVDFPLGIKFYYYGYPTKTGLVFDQNTITGYQVLEGDLKLDI